MQALRASSKTWKSIDIGAATQAISLQSLDTLIPNKIPRRSNRKRFRTTQGVEPNATVAINHITSLIWLHKLNPSHFQSLSQITLTGFWIIWQQGHVIGGRSWFGSGSVGCAKGGGRVSRVQPRRQNRTTPATVELSRTIFGGGACSLYPVIVLIWETQRAPWNISLFWECRDCSLWWWVWDYWLNRCCIRDWESHIAAGNNKDSAQQQQQLKSLELEAWWWFWRQCQCHSCFKTLCWRKKGEGWVWRSECGCGLVVSPTTEERDYCGMVWCGMGVVVALLVVGVRIQNQRKGKGK